MSVPFFCVFEFEGKVDRVGVLAKFAGIHVVRYDTFIVVAVMLFDSRI